jgi:2,5-diamino-6-(ribosylamino)-4(3H)-pyrimidinone 5'-phosphate reductase
VDRPFVTVNMAMSADGKITSSRREYAEFTSRLDKRTMDRLRAEADAVLLGAGTVRADDPPLQIRDPEMKAHRQSLGKPSALLTVVVTASLRLDPGSRFFRKGDPGSRIVATVEDAPAERRAAFAEHATVWTVGRGRVDVVELLRRLKAQGVERLLVEGGGETNWSFFEHDAIDEMYVTLAPCLFGGREAPTPVEGEGVSMAQRRRLRLVSAEPVEGEVFLRYAVER